MAQVALLRTDDRTEALREIAAELLGMDEPRRRFAAEMSGLGAHYDLGDGHPLLARRIPDLERDTANGSRRLFTLMHQARPVLLHLGGPRRAIAGTASWRRTNSECDRLDAPRALSDVHGQLYAFVPERR